MPVADDPEPPDGRPRSTILAAVPGLGRSPAAAPAISLDAARGARDGRGRAAWLRSGSVTGQGLEPERGMRFGIDAHSVEREGEGNATYGRELIAALWRTAGRHDFVLFAGDRTHHFYRSLPLRPGSSWARVVQGGGVARLGWALGRAASRAGVDGLHTQYTAPLGYRGPIVLTVHDLGFLHLPGSFPPALRLALRVLVPRSLARAQRIITDSRWARADLLARSAVDPARVVVIPLAAGTRFRPQGPAETAAVLARHGLRPGFLFCLGRLNRRKNLDRLLLAHARLRAAGVTDAPLVIGGKPDHGGPPRLRGVPVRSDDPAVRFVGMIPDADLPAFYAGASCFVYPSLLEGFGLPPLEAMACGTPVVVSKRAALPELVGEAGLLIDPQNVDDMAAAIATVLGDAALAGELGARGLQRSQHYSWEATARLTLDVYRQAASP